jgi:hypothetical protein
MSTSKRWARPGFAAVAWLFAACNIVQIYLAGLGVFESPDAFLTHRDFGYLFGVLTLVMLVLALVGRLPRAMIGATVALLVLFALQSVFVIVRSGAPALAALHPVNGFLIAGISIVVAWHARRYFRTEPSSTVVTPPLQAELNPPPSE